MQKNTFRCWEYFDCGMEAICLAFRFRDNNNMVYFCGKYCIVDKYNTCKSPYGFTQTGSSLVDVCKKCTKYKKF